MGQRSFGTCASMEDLTPARTCSTAHRQLCRSTHYEHGSHVAFDSALEEALENEPIVLEEDRKDASGFNHSAQTRWPHMSEEAEARLHDHLSGKDDRELKRKARESR